MGWDGGWGGERERELYVQTHAQHSPAASTLKNRKLLRKGGREGGRDSLPDSLSSFLFFTVDVAGKC